MGCPSGAVVGGGTGERRVVCWDLALSQILGCRTNTGGGKNATLGHTPQRGLPLGYDQPERSNSSGAIVAVLVIVLLVAVLGGLFVVGGGYLWMRTGRVQQQAALAE